MLTRPLPTSSVPPWAMTRLQLRPAKTVKSSVEPFVTPIVPLTVQVAVAVVQLQRRPPGTPSAAAWWSWWSERRRRPRELRRRPEPARAVDAWRHPPRRRDVSPVALRPLAGYGVHSAGRRRP